MTKSRVLLALVAPILLLSACSASTHQSAPPTTQVSKTDKFCAAVASYQTDRQLPFSYNAENAGKGLPLAWNPTNQAAARVLNSAATQAQEAANALSPATTRTTTAGLTPDAFTANYFKTLAAATKKVAASPAALTNIYDESPGNINAPPLPLNTNLAAAENDALRFVQNYSCSGTPTTTTTSHLPAADTAFCTGYYQTKADVPQPTAPLAQNVTLLNRTAAALTRSAKYAPDAQTRNATLAYAIILRDVANDPASIDWLYSVPTPGAPATSVSARPAAGRSAGAFENLYIDQVNRWSCPPYDSSSPVQTRAPSNQAEESALAISRDAVAIAATNGVAPSATDVDKAISETSGLSISVVAGSNLGQIDFDSQMVKYSVAGHASPICVDMPTAVNGTPALTDC